MPNNDKSDVYTDPPPQPKGIGGHMWPGPIGMTNGVITCWSETTTREFAEEYCRKHGVKMSSNCIFAQEAG